MTVEIRGVRNQRCLQDKKVCLQPGVAQKVLLSGFCERINQSSKQLQGLGLGWLGIRTLSELVRAKVSNAHRFNQRMASSFRKLDHM